MATNIFTRKRMMLDNNVWLVMLTSVVLSIGLFGYNMANRKDKPCDAIDVYVNGHVNVDKMVFNLGDALTLSVPAGIDDEVVWEFSDGKKEKGASLIHIFKKEGEYLVKAFVNEKCIYQKKVSIKKPVVELRDVEGNVLQPIISQDDAKTGEEVLFATQLEAEKYEWFVENNSNFKPQIAAQANFTFKTEGTYTVMLQLNGSVDRRFRKRIIVSSKSSSIDTERPTKIIKDEIEEVTDILNAEDEKKEETTENKTPAVPKPKPKIIEISSEILHTYLQSFICGSEMNFDLYVCAGNATVIVNGKERKTFAELLADIKGKKIKINWVEITGKDEATRCITQLNVKYDKKGRFENNPCK
jgi:hypothetical protein